MKLIINSLIFLIMGLMIINGCTNKQNPAAVSNDDFNYVVDQFEDMRVLKYKLPGFEKLTLDQKKFVYYLGEAAISGRDILWMQNFRFNLLIRKTFESLINYSSVDKESDDYKALITYAKQMFFANGIHHHYSNDKFKPAFSKEYFERLVRNCNPDVLPLEKGENVNNFISFITPLIFDETLYSRKIEQRTGYDLVTSSATNMYQGVTRKEVEDFYAGKLNVKDLRPISTGLNTKVVKKDGKIIDEVYKSGGLYGQAIDKIIANLEKAIPFAENETQKKELGVLIEYYKTGELKKWDDYNVIWAGDNLPVVDYTNGFIETYDDPLGMKASWEAIVNYKDLEATKRTDLISANAQWFEDNSPIQPQYRKEKVTGVAAKVINIAMLGGACYPVSPLGINLPNADWIRKDVGSKSVTLANISSARDIADQGNGFLDEFAADKNEIERAKKYGIPADALHTDLHECIGHASGKLAEGTDPKALKNYFSPLEEARADLFALYFIMDRKILELGLLPNEEAAKAEYDSYIRTGLMTQLVRIKPGKDIEEAHMRCRSAISQWVYEHGKDSKIIEMFKRDGKTYVKINDYVKLRTLFGVLLKEIQRVKSEGDFEAGKKIIEDFGVKVDQQIHKEILERYTKLNLAPYTGFVNPRLIPVYDSLGVISDIKVEYTDDFMGQMLYYGKNYSFLPAIN
jgi:dipeptidyl-peptidase III